MKTIARIFAIFSVLVVVSACGAESGADDSAAPENAPSTPTSSSQTDAADEDAGADVVSVTLRRTGGLKPITVTRVFAADAKPPAGFDATDVDAALAAASRFSTADVRVSPVPMDTCCDRCTYEITISYADGTSKSVNTIDGLQQPRVFQQLLQAVS